MLHKYVLLKHVYVAGIRCNYTLHKYVLFWHLYVPTIRCNHTFYFNVYTLQLYVAIIRCNYTLCFDMYTLQLYAASIRYVSTCIRCNYMLQLYAARIRRFWTCIRCNYTLQLYDQCDTRICAFLHVYAIIQDRVYVRLRSSIRCRIRRFRAHICYLWKSRIRTWAATIRCKNTQVFDMYTLQLYAATIRSIYAITR